VSLAGTAHRVEFDNGRHLVVPVVLSGAIGRCGLAWRDKWTSQLLEYIYI